MTTNDGSASHAARAVKLSSPNTSVPAMAA
jgi:hypothetical protein